MQDRDCGRFLLLYELEWFAEVLELLWRGLRIPFLVDAAVELRVRINGAVVRHFRCNLKVKFLW